MPDNAKGSVTVKVLGQPIEDGSLPRVFGAGVRAAGGADDVFLPAGLVKVAQAFDVSQRSRDAGGRPAELVPKPDQVLALELADNITLITSADKLHETLKRIDPDALEDAAVPIDALRSRGEAMRGWIGDAAGDLVSRVFALDIASDDIILAAKRKALEWLGENVDARLAEYGGLGVTWIGTKALMWAIESRLARAPGLYRWIGAQGEPTDLFALGDAALAREAAHGPLLVFIHGTGSSTVGSFGDLQNVSREDWKALEAKFGERIYAFEHRTLSESPIDNAVALAQALPNGARVNLVTHSRGGLVGDLLCLGKLDDALIDGFAVGDDALAGAEGERRERLRQELEQAYAEQRTRLRELRELLRRKAFHIERYVRVASPARGTRLASSNFDVFLSSLLWLIGNAPYLAGNPLYSAFKRVVLEIAKNRTDPGLVPGIEAMLPESPTGRFLARAAPKEGMQLAVIAGDIEGGGLLKRLGVLFTDFVFFDRYDNDLVVDTDSMYAGLARPGQARRRFEQGPGINHFGYFANQSSRLALRDWLTGPDPALLGAFEPIPELRREISLDEELDLDKTIVLSRGGAAAAANLPVVIVLPGTMGSHLHLKANDDRVWFDPLDIAVGGLNKIRWGRPDVEAEKLFDAFYGDLCRDLLATHRVERYPYDWRLGLDNLADGLAQCLRRVLDETAQPQRPVRILAHSMGGLVVRALIAKHAALWDETMQRDGARLVMLGTPNQGSHLMVESLLGKSDSMRNLARLDQAHDLQGVLDIVAEFRGALQLLPKPGFVDAGGAQAQQDDYFLAEVWEAFRKLNKDFWFGNQVAGVPPQAALDDGRWLWDRDGSGTPKLPDQYKDKVIYVFGRAANTPCGVRAQGDRWKMVGTAQGDGSVTWKSGAIEGIGAFFNMPAEHGALTASEEYFPALADLLERGATARLPAGKPALRAAEAERTVTYDAGPTPYPSADEALYSLLGARPPKHAKVPAARPLEVSCVAMDLRFATMPVMVGHYEQDPISGAEALIDRELVDGELTMRHHLGLYAGRTGTATVVLFMPNEQERLRGSYRGAVVTGLGQYGELSAAALTEAVRVGTLRYLLQLIDNGEGRKSSSAAAPEVCLSSLLLGHNSTTNISVEDSVAALVRGVLAANHQFTQTMKCDLRVTRLELIEVYIDTAIAAAKALCRVAERIGAYAARHGMRIEASRELKQRSGWRQRLDVLASQAYWPRMIVTDADRREDERAEDFHESLPPAAAAAASMAVPARSALAPRTALAQRLRFAYLGQRARAETEVQQRQPGLVDRLVDKSIKATSYSEDFSRALFQLLVPHYFKDVARQIDRVALVLDAYTANFPWELMLADDQPLAIKTAMVRQLSSTRYRPHLRQSVDLVAYVVGNPSTAGFGKVFPGPQGKTQTDPDALGGAEEEARAVATLLTRQRFQVVEAIGGDQTALDVINKLYRRPYRIVHIAAHGIFDQPAADGLPRSGVVLSDGVLITAAEIEAMEVVPDLVFLNCCHLGKVDRGPIAFNRLAYSVARQLIEMGVRAVVVAGWPVDDTAAHLFAEVFYTELLDANRPLGDAAFVARKRVFDKYPASNTWGAYQVYGDPGFVMDPQRESGQPSQRNEWKPVSPDELVERLANIQAAIARSPDQLSSSATRAHATDAQRALAACPADWKEMPHVRALQGQLYAQLGGAHFDEARAHYLAAIRAEDKQGRVPLQAIEQLANIEARQGEEGDDEALIELAIERLSRLCELSALGETGEGPDQARDHPGNAERAALLGSAYKRKAALYARRLCARKDKSESDREAFLQALGCSVDWYRRAEGKPGTSGFQPYLALNRLGLQALRDFTKRAALDRGEIELVRASALAAREAFRASPDFFKAVMPAEALLVEALLDRSLGAKDRTGERVVAAVRHAYDAALKNVPGTPRERDSVVQQICLLKCLYQAQGVLDGDDEGTARLIADRLELLADQIVPGACRGQRGGGSPPPGADGAVTGASSGSPAAPRQKKKPAKKSPAPVKKPRFTKKGAEP